MSQMPLRCRWGPRTLFELLVVGHHVVGEPEPLGFHDDPHHRVAALGINASMNRQSALHTIVAGGSWLRGSVPCRSIMSRPVSPWAAKTCRTPSQPIPGLDVVADVASCGRRPRRG
jgi:hypothetical protein